MTQQHALLIIDAQQDFCLPNGALYVPGAEEDMARLSAFILRELVHIDAIFVTLDTHHVNDIAHPAFWVDAEGRHPDPFTLISHHDVQLGKWRPRFTSQSEVLSYLHALEAEGEYLHCIWPEHCLWGTQGHALHPAVAEACQRWARYHAKNYTVIEKGMHPLTEHFGVFRAQVPRADAPDTQLNVWLLNALDSYQTIWVAGEARSHCVATSLKQLMQYRPTMLSKLCILENCMSDVAGMGHLADPIYEQLRAHSVRFIQTQDVDL